MKNESVKRNMAKDITKDMLKNVAKDIVAKYEIGIDEAGRGPLAGPVSVGGFMFLNSAANSRSVVKRFFRGVKESKQLSEEKREEWFAKIQKAAEEGLVKYSVKLISHKIIDKKGLSFAIKKGVAGVLKELVNNPINDSKNPSDYLVLLDGGLKPSPEFTNFKTIIKGDEKVQIIALASICAKVTRDRYMHKMHKKYPDYGFNVHKGYGTKKHYQAIKENGVLEIHRKCFL